MTFVTIIKDLKENYGNLTQLRIEIYNNIKRFVNGNYANIQNEAPLILLPQILNEPPSYEFVDAVEIDHNSLEEYVKNGLKDGTCQQISYIMDNPIDGTPYKSYSYDAIDNKLFYFPEFNVFIAKVVIDWGGGSTSYERIALSVGSEPLDRFYSALNEYQVDVFKRRIRQAVMTQSSFTPILYSFADKNTDVFEDNIYMDQALKTDIISSVDKFFNGGPELYAKYNIPYKRGILLHGAPGNGKTTLLKYIMSMVSVPVINWQVNEEVSSMGISILFNDMKEFKNGSILIIEDMDSMPERCRSTFLNSLDGYSSGNGLFIIGTTNFPEKVDPALMNRAGRFDRAYEIPKPTAELRKAYLMSRGIIDIITEDDLDYIVKETDDFSMSIMNEIIATIVLQSIDNTVDIHRMIRELKDVKKKQEKGNFELEKKASAGFI